MDAVVSLLDQHHEALVHELWGELEREFGIGHLLKRVPIPHFSYYVAEKIDQEHIKSTLHGFATLSEPFRVRGTGLALFTGPEPVLYVPIVRTAELSHLHHALLPYVMESATGMLEYYQGARWMPHITLAQGDLNDANLPRLLSRWMNRSFEWDIVIDNVSLICEMPDAAAECRMRIEFGV